MEQRRDRKWDLGINVARTEEFHLRGCCMLKRTIMTALAVSLLATPAAAQSIGFKLGMTSSTIDGSDDDGVSFDRLTSLGVGGFLRFGPLQIDVLGMT
jgi:hypothetical protein